MVIIMNAIIVSDLHIGSRYFFRDAFALFLETIPQDHELILNGDTIDNPYAKLQPSDRQILDLIKQLSLRQRVTCLKGNHDNGYLPDRFGKIQFMRHHAIEKRLLVSHGDDFDEIMPRSRAFIKAFNMMHNLRVRLGAKPVHVAEYAKKWKSFYKILRKNVMLNAVKCARENNYQAVACGHTHYAEDRNLNGIRYFNTGAWTEFPAFFLHVTPNDMALRTIDNSFKAIKSSRIQGFHLNDSELPRFENLEKALKTQFGCVETKHAAPLYFK